MLLAQNRRVRTRLTALDDRDTNKAAPLGPRAVVVLDGVKAKQVPQNEPGVAAAFADSAICDDIVATLKLGLVQV